MKFETINITRDPDTLEGLYALGEIPIKEAFKGDVVGNGARESDTEILQRRIAHGEGCKMRLDFTKRVGEQLYFSIYISVPRNGCSKSIDIKNIDKYLVMRDASSGDWILVFSTMFDHYVYSINIGKNADFDAAAGVDNKN